ncbi:hypothetical protein ABTY96_22795 [Streptomyces sp. NPDC096057]|uniref:hypothetical protein n=1 Tax=Streptomyces sp. NPDC096057 TaxID=3155543 RepID=UPI00332D8661
MFAALLLLNGLGQGMVSAPNTSPITGSVPSECRGVASGMRSTFQDSSTALSVGVFFSPMVPGLASSLPHTLGQGLQAHGVPTGAAERAASLPPASTLFATFLGNNPIQHLLASDGTLEHVSAEHVSAAQRAVLTGHTFFPRLVSGPFHHSLTIVFGVAAGMATISAVASALRGGRRPDLDNLDTGPSPADRPTAPTETPETSQAWPNSAS